VRLTSKSHQSTVECSGMVFSLWPVTASWSGWMKAVANVRTRSTMGDGEEGTDACAGCFLFRMEYHRERERERERESRARGSTAARDAGTAGREEQHCRSRRAALPVVGTALPGVKSSSAGGFGPHCRGWGAALPGGGDRTAGRGGPALPVVGDSTAPVGDQHCRS
jgi:hypothetical protein